MNKFRVFLVSVIALQILSVLTAVIGFLPLVLRPLIVLMGLVYFPGVLSACVAYQRQRASLWQIMGLGCALGLAEMLLVGRILLTFGLEVRWLGYVITGASILKVIFLWSRKPEFTTATVNKLREPLLLYVVPLGFLLLFEITLITTNLSYPGYAVNTNDSRRLADGINDKWSYLAVIEQFRFSPGDLNLRPEAVIFGSNTRLSWNSWLYFSASMSELTTIHPVQLIFNYFRPALSVLTIFSLTFFGYEVFGKSWLAWVGTALQLAFATALLIFSHYLWMRLEEDKFFAFFTLIPLGWAFLLRSIRYQRWQDLFGLSAISLALALIHPMGLLGLLLTGVPFTLIEWWYQRKQNFSVRRLIVILVGMMAFLSVTYIDRLLVYATPYVQSRLNEEGTLPTYDFLQAPNLMSPNTRFILLAFIPLLWFFRKDQIARFLGLSALSCVVVLSVPPITALASRLTARVGLDRYQWLIPTGFIATWLLLKFFEWLERDHPRLVYRAQVILPTALLGCLVVVSSWSQWSRDGLGWLLRQDTPQPTLVMSDKIWQGFLDTAPLVDGKRALTPTDYGLAAPTLWPGASLLIFNSPIHAPVNWPKIELFYKSEDIPTTWVLMDDLQGQAIFVPHDTPLYSTLSANPRWLNEVYRNDEASLFVAERSDLTLPSDTLSFTSNQYTIAPGKCVEILWESAGFEALEYQGKPAEDVGSQRECPSETSIYEIRGKRADGTSILKQLRVFVSSDYDYVLSFQADRYLISSGECVTLQWDAEGIDSIFYSDPNNGTVGHSTAQECPTTTTGYALYVKLQNGTALARLITIYVDNSASIAAQ